jgi:hypothetical protein
VFGTYVVTVKDSLGAIIRETVVLQIPNNRTSYQVYLNTTSRKTVESVTTNTTEYTTSVRVSPTLPSGTTITFDISHTDLYKVSPTQTASTLTIGSILIKNGEEISIFDTNTSTTNVTNTNAGCQNNLIYTTATTENWNGISMSYNDDIKIITSVSNYKPQNVPCYFVQNTESYSLSNLSITGCTNCEVVNQENT